jgi:hypothetical protein
MRGKGGEDEEQQGERLIQTMDDHQISSNRNRNRKTKFKLPAASWKIGRTRAAALMLSRPSNPWQDKAEFCSLQVGFG